MWINNLNSVVKGKNGEGLDHFYSCNEEVQGVQINTLCFQTNVLEMLFQYFSFRLRTILTIVIFFDPVDVCAGCGASHDQDPNTSPQTRGSAGQRVRDRTEGAKEPNVRQRLREEKEEKKRKKRKIIKTRCSEIKTWLNLTGSVRFPRNISQELFKKLIVSVEKWEPFLDLCCLVLPHNLRNGDKLLTVYKLAELGNEKLAVLSTFFGDKNLEPSWRLVREGGRWRKILNLFTTDDLEEVKKFFVPIRLLSKCGFEIDEACRAAYKSLWLSVVHYDPAQCKDLVELCHSTFYPTMLADDRFEILKEGLLKLSYRHYSEYEKTLKDPLLKMMMKHRNEASKKVLLRVLLVLINQGRAFDSSLTPAIYKYERDHFLYGFVEEENTVTSICIEGMLAKFTEDVQPNFIVLCCWLTGFDTSVSDKFKDVRWLFNLVKKLEGEGVNPLNYTNLCLSILQTGLTKTEIRDAIESLAKLGVDRYETQPCVWTANQLRPSEETQGEILTDAGQDREIEVGVTLRSNSSLGSQESLSADISL